MQVIIKTEQMTKPEDLLQYKTKKTKERRFFQDEALLLPSTHIILPFQQFSSHDSVAL
jgi:hypothetical protein